VPEADREGYVFNPIGRTGKRIRFDNLSKRISEFGRKANVKVAESRGKTKYASAHDLRRTFGTRWAQRVKPAVLPKLMRHASIQTTQDYYVTLDSDDVADIVWNSMPANTSANTSPEGAEKQNGQLTEIVAR